ncbi:MAG: hypothetical protein Q9219_004188 [cf. Caloplaca sp. 3 TL-2023]
MERRRCNHHELDDPLSTLDCLSNVIDPKKSATNRNRYCVASQEEEVRRFCRSVKGVPLIYVKRSVMILEPMAESTVGVKEGIEREKFRTGLRARVGKRKRDSEEGRGAENENENEDQTEGIIADGEGRAGEEKATKSKKTRGPKGPNPLSVKKSKKELAKAQEVGGGASTAVREQSADQIQGTTGVILEAIDGTRAPPGKRKRKRKSKTGTLKELETENSERS